MAGTFGALAFGVGTSDVEHVLATQCLAIRPMKRMQVRVEGPLAAGLTAKDLVLHIIGVLGTAGATGYAIEFSGSTVRDLSMEGRMTVCNMAIEAGARVGLVGVDDKTIDYLRGRPQAPQGTQWESAVAAWRTLVSDADAKFDTVVTLDAAPAPQAAEIRKRMAEVTLSDAQSILLDSDEPRTSRAAPAAADTHHHACRL